MSDRTYIAIDLKSFYASVECMDRNLDPMTTNLVVADESRTEKPICLAVSPSLKAHGIPGRARLFEVIQRVREVNADRRHRATRGQFTGKSVNAPELKSNPALELGYVVAVPRMARYMKVSAKIYSVYLKFVSPDDIHVYSIEEVFIDATSYLKLYKLTAREFAMKMIREVLQTTGITATAGIGPNMYLCKIAMDIEAKHIQADKDGVRIAELTERSYREKMWSHRPLTDFWRVGKGYASKLEAAGMSARISFFTRSPAFAYKVQKKVLLLGELQNFFHRNLFFSDRCCKAGFVQYKTHDIPFILKIDCCNISI